MDLDKENDFKGLTLLKTRPYFLEKELTQAFTSFVNWNDAVSLFDNFYNKGYFNQTDDLTLGTKENPSFPGSIALLKQYSISHLGEQYLIRLTKEIEREDIEERKLKVDLSNAEKTLKTYWSTRLIAWLSFIFSAIGLFLSIARALNIWPYHK